ncbi:MAG: transcription elongation factor GreA [Clostridiales bacterium]|nr:transcription elongation factor GreA [Clostridiales bacterium]
MAKQITITNEGLKKLNEELEDLRTNKRKEVAEALKEARSFGDLSENSEYDEAKDTQSKVENRIAELEEMLKNVRVIDDSAVSTNTVSVGVKVKVRDERFDEDREYKIVGTTQANPDVGEISDHSPIGHALLGAKVGDVVTAVAPIGNIKLKVLEISK